VRRRHTTISCRAFALIALAIAIGTSRAAVAGDKPQPPKLPLAAWWSVLLDGQVGAPPSSDGKRIYVALTSGALTARDDADGHELWRVKKMVTAPMAAGGDLLFVAAGDAIEAIRGASGAGVWVLPRATPVAPLRLSGETLFVVTDKELIAVRAATGDVVWRHAVEGVRLAPSVDAGRVYTGADDGQVLALNVTDGSQAWERFFKGGVTALGAAQGLVYVGAGYKVLYCLQGAKKGNEEWYFRIGGIPVGRIAVDESRVYVSAKDNVVHAFDRKNGNQRWNAGLRERPTFGVYMSGHVIFVPASANELMMLYDHDGSPSGTLALPGDIPANLLPALIDAEDGPIIYAVTGEPTNEWRLTKFARAGEAALLPFAGLDPLPGLPYLTDPSLMTIGNVLQDLVLGDPLLRPLSDMGWPVVLRDPPLMPITVFPGLQLRPLSPALPVRRAGPGPGG
jgi:outer membrane protein assembly factor BamB